MDEHIILLEGLQQIIDRQPDLKCSATACNGDEALRLLQADIPDLLTVDISMLGRSGLELIRDVVALHQDLPILVLSMHDEGLYAQSALKAGARGYVMKEANSA